jgi:hypothetical protein
MKGEGPRPISTHIPRTFFFIYSLLACPYPSPLTAPAAAPPVRAARRSATATSRASAEWPGGLGDRMGASRGGVGRDDDATGRLGWVRIELTSDGSERGVLTASGILIASPQMLYLQSCLRSQTCLQKLCNAGSACKNSCHINKHILMPIISMFDRIFSKSSK